MQEWFIIALSHAVYTDAFTIVTKVGICLWHLSLSLLPIIAACLDSWDNLHALGDPAGNMQSWHTLPMFFTHLRNPRGGSTAELEGCVHLLLTYLRNKQCPKVVTRSRTCLYMLSFRAIILPDSHQY